MKMLMVGFCALCLVIGLVLGGSIERSYPSPRPELATARHDVRQAWLALTLLYDEPNEVPPSYAEAMDKIRASLQEAEEVLASFGAI